MYCIAWLRILAVKAYYHHKEKSTMNKTELIEGLAEKTGVSKVKAAESLEALLELITTSVSKGDGLTLVGFGTFSRGERAARVGRNPRTGEVLKISASKTVKFTAGKAFKEAVNKKKK